MIDDGLHELASSLLERFGDEAARAGKPVFLEIGSGADGEPSLTSIRRRAALLGWTAPVTCAAVATVATGRIRQLDESAELPASLIPALAGGLRISCLVSRDGSIGWRTDLPGGGELRDVPQEGKVLDVLRRCLGLPTPPPPCPVGRLHCITWMQFLMGSGGRRLRWNEVLQLHPVVIVDPAPGDPEAVIRTQGWAQSWERLRVAIASEANDNWEPPSDLAAWMDEGMFARWTLEHLPPVEELLEIVRPALVPSAARKLSHLVHEVSCASEELEWAQRDLNP